MRTRCAALVVAALLLGTAACGHGPAAATSPRAATPSAVPSRPPAAEPGRNRALAAAEAARVLAAIPLPPGATVHGRFEPAGSRGRVGCQCGPVDPSLTRTAWWTVPMPYRQLVHWYAAHSPANPGSAHGPDGSISAHGVLSWEADVSSPAYSTPAVVVSYARKGPTGTAIRTDVTLAARYDRTASTRVPPDVTRVDITRTALGGGPHPTSATVTDPALLGEITSAFNGLGGAFAHALPAACGSPAGRPHLYAVTFHWPGHTLAVDPGQPLCGVGMRLTLDGVRLTRRLAGDQTLDAALEAAL